MRNRKYGDKRLRQSRTIPLDNFRRLRLRQEQKTIKV